MKNIIFDMDGTLLDSMPYWENVTSEYAQNQGLEITDEIRNQIYLLSFDEICELLHEKVESKQPTNDIKKYILDIMNQHYRNDIPMKQGMKELIEHEYNIGTHLSIFTASDKSCVINAFSRLGILKYFEYIFTVKELGIVKSESESFQQLFHILGYDPAETYVYEDSLHCIRSALTTGCHVVGVYDKASDAYWNQIQELCEKTIKLDD